MVRRSVFAKRVAKQIKRSAGRAPVQKEFNGKKRKSNGDRARSQKKKCLTGAVAEVKERISDGSFRRINGKRHVPNESFERKEACAQEELRDDTRACF